MGLLLFLSLVNGTVELLSALLLVMNFATVSICVQGLNTCFPFVWPLCPGEELLSHGGSLELIAPSPMQCSRESGFSTSLACT